MNKFDKECEDLNKIISKDSETLLQAVREACEKRDLNALEKAFENASKRYDEHQKIRKDISKRRLEEINRNYNTMINFF